MSLARRPCGMMCDRKVRIVMRASRLHVGVAAALLCGACGSDSAGRGGTGHHVVIRETSYGIPHVLADDLTSAVAGLGYVGARDYGCILLDQIVRVRSERYGKNWARPLTAPDLFAYYYWLAQLASDDPRAPPRRLASPTMATS